MCSFDINNLFTCAPISGIIDICTDFLYRSQIFAPAIPENVFVELIRFFVMSVEFLWQIDGLSVGSVLGSTLANIFVGFHENHIFSWIAKLLTYYLYVDDTFCFFGDVMEANFVFSLLNDMHSTLNYFMEIETNSTLSFLDVLVTRTPSG